MKRIGNLYEKIYDMDNLVLADKLASRGKKNQKGVVLHKQNQKTNLESLQHVLKDNQFQTSEYTVFTIFEPKERHIYSLPYYPDRIVHHAIMNVLEPYFLPTFTRDTYSSIKGRGIHAAASSLKKALKDKTGTTYCLKMDIRKFYPSINHTILMTLLERKFKDENLLSLLGNIIDSAEGLPIGSYLSQYLSNFYLTYFDHWLKEELRIKYYWRYADDMVILSSDKGYLHDIKNQITAYLSENLKLQVKDNWQVYPVASRGIDFLGYRFFHTHTLLRKSIKQNFARAMAKKPSGETVASYKGWAKHCNSKHLIKALTQ